MLSVVKKLSKVKVKTIFEFSDIEVIYDFIMRYLRGVRR